MADNTKLKVMKANKMLKLIGIINLMWLIVTYPGNAQPVRKTITTGGFDREYLIYTPQNPLEKAEGLLVCLHGFGRTMNDFFGQYDILALADQLNLIVAAPQALPEQDPEILQKANLLASIANNEISLHSVWGCGLGVRVSMAGFVAINEELNKDVDDVSFIDLMIDDIMTENDLPDENIFMLGTSMGGYMTYQYALLKGERLSGIISLAGSMGLNIKGMDKAVKIPVCDFHSVTDEVVPYTGSQTQMGYTIALAKPMTDVINFWSQVNETGDPITEPVEIYTPTNKITVEKITYPDADNEVIHYKIDGASHSYFFKKEAGDCMDHVEEITKFITSHHTGISHNEPIVTEQKSVFYPNPVYDRIYLNNAEGIISIYDITGRKLFTQPFTAGQTDLSALRPGLYIIQIQSGNTIQVSKLIKR